MNCFVLFPVNISTQVIVIGGGMAGLAASATLIQSGLDVLLVEAANYLGTFHMRKNTDISSNFVCTVFKL